MTDPAPAPPAAKPQDSSAPEENPSSDARDPAYFGYYAMLQHQQNMLQDTVRTSTYRSAIVLNTDCFENKVVMDVGAGSGILSYFAVQSGAKQVYAVEASAMASKMQKLVAAASLPAPHTKNAFLKDKITVIQSKIEDAKVLTRLPKDPETKDHRIIDTLISEPIGVLLVHERMIESFIYARDEFLKPGGFMFPNKGTMFLAPFTDALLFTETMAKSRFWEQDQFHGVDLSVLYSDAKQEMFGMPVVGHFDPKSLLAQPNPEGEYVMDFTSITMSELRNFAVPFMWKSQYTGLMHGVAGWFDLLFSGNPEWEHATPIEMSTGPSSEKTHWQQVRFLFREPLAVNAGQMIRGWMHCVVNDMRSYTVDIEVIAGAYGELTDVKEMMNSSATEKEEIAADKKEAAGSIPNSKTTNKKRTDRFLELLERTNDRAVLRAKMASGEEPDREPYYTEEEQDEEELDFVRRRGRWELHEQSYNYSYTGGAGGGLHDLTKPEHLCMYEPDQI